MAITYSEIQEGEFQAWLMLSHKLWKDYKRSALKKELQRVFKDVNQHTFIAKSKKHGAIGFINVAVRNDYVEGAKNSPTGYLEGIFVEKKYRKKGIARKLVKMAEQWLKQNNCSQIGSDTWLDNKGSKKFHKKLGFWEEEKLIHFLKNIE